MAAPAKKKKGLSMEEKREIMLNICLESKEVFNLKELEKLGSKAGVVLQTVKDVVQSLVDDHLIEVDKIGSGNFYWAFPSKAFMGLKTRAEGLEAAVAAETAAITELESRLAKLNAGRDASDGRAEKLTELAALKTQREALEKKVKAHADSDPEALKEMKAKVKVAMDAANRWTDNVWTLKSHLVDKFNKAPNEADQLIGIGDDFDYVH